MALPLVNQPKSYAFPVDGAIAAWAYVSKALPGKGLCVVPRIAFADGFPDEPEPRSKAELIDYRRIQRLLG